MHVVAAVLSSRQLLAAVMEEEEAVTPLQHASASTDGSERASGPDGWSEGVGESARRRCRVAGCKLERHKPAMPVAMSPCNHAANMSPERHETSGGLLRSDDHHALT